MFPERLKKLRIENNISPEELARYLGLVSANSIYQYESGIRQPKFEKLIMLCNKFNVSADYILGLSDYKNPENDLKVSPLIYDLLERLDELTEEEIKLICIFLEGLISRRKFF